MLDEDAVQRGAPDADPATLGKGGFSYRIFPQEADAAKRGSQRPIDPHPDFRKRCKPIRHQTFAARLVDRRPPSVDDDDIEPPLAGGECCREACGPAADNDEIGFGGWSGAHHCNRIISEQKPGPIASRIPRLPGFGGPFAITSSSTSRTEGEERLP